jgi:tRNA(His) 5'-end guanylyltransferase
MKDFISKKGIKTLASASIDAYSLLFFSKKKPFISREEELRSRSANLSKTSR